MPSSVSALFSETFGRPPESVGRAPGRVNLIGEHTDYNSGLCLPVALPHSTYAAVARRSDHRVRLVSAQQSEPWEGDAESAKGWAGYAAGVVWALREAGLDVPGVDIAVDSAVPQGAGLSSSAALECAVAVAVSGMVGGISRDLVVAAGMRAEAEVVGAPTGGMDQTVAMYAEPGSALLIDFADDSRRAVPWHPEGLTLLVVNTRVSHALADGEYAARRRDCETACAELGVSSLREVGLGQVPDGPENWKRRARHVTSENARVAAFVSAVEEGDWNTVGALMSASHDSLRQDYGVSCAELDLAVEVALGQGALGARMTGGGFGGCALALVADDLVLELTRALTAAYAAAGWRVPMFLVGEAAGPAELL